MRICWGKRFIYFHSILNTATVVFFYEIIIIIFFELFNVSCVSCKWNVIIGSHYKTKSLSAFLFLYIHLLMYLIKMTRRRLNKKGSKLLWNARSFLCARFILIGLQVQLVLHLRVVSFHVLFEIMVIYLHILMRGGWGACISLSLNGFNAASFYVYLMYVIIVDKKHSIYIINVDHYLKLWKRERMLAHPHRTYLLLLLRQIYYVNV